MKKVDQMKLTKGIISREQALKIAPDYVGFFTPEGRPDFDSKTWEKVYDAFDKLTVGQKVITLDWDTNQWILAKVTSVQPPLPEADTHRVRVGNGEYTWRVDGMNLAYPVK